MKNKKRLAIGAGVMSGCLVLAGTFAWFSTTDKVTNKFQMDAFDISLTEDFDEDVPMIPGADITKNVTVTNTGKGSALVRVKLEEVLKLLERDTTDGVNKLKVNWETSAETSNENYVKVLVSQEMIDAYKAAKYEDYEAEGVGDSITVLRKETTATKGDGTKNTTYSYVAYVTETKQLVKVTPTAYAGDDKSNPTEFTVEYAFNNYKETGVGTGKYEVSGSHDTVDTELDAYYDGTFHNDVTLNFADGVDYDQNGSKEEGATWYLGTDGYFYYTAVLEGNSISAPLLDSVSISKDATNKLQGAYYELTPVMEAVQVNQEAVNTNWSGYTSDTIVEGIVNGLIPSAEG